MVNDRCRSAARAFAFLALCVYVFIYYYFWCDLLSHLDGDVGGLSSGERLGLVEHDGPVGQRVALALRAAAATQPHEHTRRKKHKRRC